MIRLTGEEEEIQEACGCYEEQPILSESRTTATAGEDDEMSSAS